jgi:hypothetical protein
MLFTINVFKEELEDTKEVIRIRISKKNRQHNGHKKKYKRSNNDLQNIHIKLEEFENTKGIIRIHNSKERQHNHGQEKKNKRTTNDLPSNTHKTEDRVT